MSEGERALYYIFILSLVLIAVAYYAGTSNVLGTLGTQFGNLLNISTGRNTQGQFGAYPGNAPLPQTVGGLH